MLEKRLENLCGFRILLHSLTERTGTSWNIGYGEKYLIDQGILYKTMSRRWNKILCLQDAIRHRKTYDVRWWTAYHMMVEK